MARPLPADGETAVWAQMWRLWRATGDGAAGDAGDGAVTKAQLAAEVATLIVGG